MCMAEWKHKERYWATTQQDQLDGSILQVQTWNGAYDQYVKTPEYKSFTDWLDWQCSGGWEVFKIKRNHNEPEMAKTWCIFRKLV